MSQWLDTIKYQITFEREQEVPHNVMAHLYAFSGIMLERMERERGMGRKGMEQEG
jgi:hypothetical protein